MSILSIVLNIAFIVISIFVLNSSYAGIALRKLMIEAEKQIETSSGKEKLKFVMDAIYVRYPLAKFLPESLLIALIEDLLKFANEFNKSSKSGNITDKK